MKKVVKTDEQWRQQLSTEAYRVARESGTEAPFTGEHLNEKRIGTFGCICCGLALFQSDAKFESGCGWPSFFKPLQGANLVEVDDLSFGRKRIEVRCAQCDAHLGHVFTDGPPPTGLRYCINSVCISFDAEAEE
jgi:peptide-methionine (R)-S-oxide reductase